MSKEIGSIIFWSINISAAKIYFIWHSLLHVSSCWYIPYTSISHTFANIDTLSIFFTKEKHVFFSLLNYCWLALLFFLIKSWYMLFIYMYSFTSTSWIFSNNSDNPFSTWSWNGRPPPVMLAPFGRMNYFLKNILYYMHY